MKLDTVTKNTQSLYDQLQFGYSYGIGNREKYYPLLQEALFLVPENGVLVDVGAGAGFWIDKYINSSIKKENIIAVDISENSLAQIKKRGVKVVCENIESMSLKNHTADIVICNGVLQHSNCPAKVFSEIARITKPEGCIYLNAYNQYHPYYYLVHKATFLLRYAYWYWDKRIADIFFPLFKVLFLPIARLVLGKWLDNKTAKTIFLDQVFVPKANLFSQATLVAYAEKNNCKTEKIQNIKYGLLIEAIFRKKD